MEEYIPPIFFIIDARGDILVRSSNSLEALAKITGTDVSYANSIYDFCLPQEKERLQQMLNSGGGVNFVPWESLRELGSDTIWLTWKTRQLFSPSGDPHDFLVTIEPALERSVSSAPQSITDPKPVDETEPLVNKLEARVINLLGDLRQKEQMLLESQPASSCLGIHSWRCQSLRFSGKKNQTMISGSYW